MATAKATMVVSPISFLIFIFEIRLLISFPHCTNNSENSG
jgi:hypothetical protein